MNKAILIGRLTADPELTTTSGGVQMCRFTIAISRPYKTQDGQEMTDFIPVVVWRAQADNCARYLSKGKQCCVEGAISVRSYEKNGERRYATEVVADRVEFLGSGGGQESTGGRSFQQSRPAAAVPSIDNLQAADDDDNLPF